MRNRMFMQSIKNDSVLGSLKFVSKNEDSQVYDKMILDVIVNDAIKNSMAYQTYREISIGASIPKKSRKGTKAENVPKKKGSFTADDNIINDDPDVKAVKASKCKSRKQFQSRGLSEGSGIIPEVPDETKYKSGDSSERVSTSQEVPDESKGKIASDNEDDWGSKDDETFLKNIKDHEVDWLSTDKDEAMNDDDKDKKMTRALLFKKPKMKELMTHKDKPDPLLSTSSHPVSSNIGNQLLNISPNVSLIGTIHENSNVEITSLMDIKIQHDVPNIQQDPLHEVTVSFISTLATLPTTPPPQVTPPPTTTTEDPIPPSSKSKTLTTVLQILSIVEQ
ncbi:hypothetical protein Tco_0685182 [Tanacetum coccineum]